MEGLKEKSRNVFQSSSFRIFNFLSTIVATLIIIIFQCFAVLFAHVLLETDASSNSTKTEFSGSSEICYV